jgi:hypothetical protein
VNGCSIDDGVREINQNSAKDVAPVGRTFVDDGIVQLAVLMAEDVRDVRFHPIVIFDQLGSDVPPIGISMESKIKQRLDLGGIIH